MYINYVYVHINCVHVRKLCLCAHKLGLCNINIVYVIFVQTAFHIQRTPLRQQIGIAERIGVKCG